MSKLLVTELVNFITYKTNSLDFMKTFHRSYKAHIIFPILVSAFKCFIFEKDKAIQYSKSVHFIR